MNEDIMRKAMDQARDLQQRVAEAMARTHEQTQPYVEQTLKHAEALRETLTQHAKESADTTHEQTIRALDHLNAAMQVGGEAVKAQAVNAKPFIDDFFKRAKEATEQVTKTFGGR